MSFIANLRQWCHAFCPKPVHACKTEPWLASLLVTLAIGWVGVSSQWLLNMTHPVLIASMAASAVLVFVLPASPFAQPWSVLGGNLLSASIGLFCAQLHWPVLTTACLAVALSIVVMFYARCLHPPSAGLALAALSSGGDYAFVYGPVLVNSMFLVACALLIHPVLGKSYPVRVPASVTETQALPKQDPSDLQQHWLLADPGWTCGDVMQPDVLCLPEDLPLRQALQQMHERQQTMVPVIDGQGRFRGFLLLQACLDRLGGHWPEPGIPVKDHCQWPGLQVEQGQPVAELVMRLVQQPWQRLAVVDNNQALVGILGQAELLFWLLEQRRLPRPELLARSA